MQYKERFPAINFTDFHMFAAELTHAGHTQRFAVSEARGIGWEVTEERDRQVVSRVRVTDWHRVERALSAIRRRVSELEQAGWRTTA
jgi:hypothetical protein